MFKTNNPEHIWNSLDHKEFLMQLGGYVVNRKDGTEGLTIAGLLMFVKGCRYVSVLIICAWTILTSQTYR